MTLQELNLMSCSNPIQQTYFVEIDAYTHIHILLVWFEGGRGILPSFHNGGHTYTSATGSSLPAVLLRCRRWLPHK